MEETKKIGITIGELKAQALLLMGVNNARGISGGDINALKDDPTYGTYIYAMNGAINRCLSRMYMVGAIGQEPARVLNTSSETSDLAEYAPDITVTLANLIPLYIVGDVFALDEPSVAQNKRNEFEDALASISDKSGQVELVYECE